MQKERASLLPELEKMRAGVDYFFPVKLRGFSVSLRPLSNNEWVECYHDVAEFMEDLPANRRSKIQEDLALAKEILIRASRPFDSKEPAKLTNLILDKMTNDELMYVYQEWQAICTRVNPSLEKTSVEILQNTVEALKKNPPQDMLSQLTELSFGQLVNLVNYLLTKDVSPMVN